MVGVAYTSNDVEKLLNRTGTLIDYIEATPNYLVDWIDAYVMAAATRMRVLAGTPGFLEVVLFANEVFNKIHDIDPDVLSEKSLSLICKSLSRAKTLFIVGHGTHMQTSKIIHIVSCHAEGEVGDVIVGGVSPPPGKTLWEQRKYIAQDQALRNFLLNEPRGGVFRHVNLLVPPKNPQADAAFIIMEPEDTPPMSGSNSICVSTVLLDSGIIPMQEPVTEMTLEAPGGLVRVYAECKNGKTERIVVENVPSFADQLNTRLELEGIGTLKVNTAYGGDSFVIVDADTLGFSITEDEAHDIASLGVKLTNAANEQIGFTHPTIPDWRHISFCLFAGLLNETADGFEARSAVAIQPGKVDRSPTGTAVCARMAVLSASGQMNIGQKLRAISIIDSVFEGQIVRATALGEKPAIVPTISGRGWITGTHQHMLDPTDPWPEGYRLSDTWGVRS